MSLAQLTGRAGRVEVTQGDESQPVGPVVTFHDPFHKELGPAVRVSRPLRMIFRDGDYLWLAVRRTGRGKDKAPHVGLEQSVEQGDALLDIVCKIARGLGNRLAHIGERCEVNACFNIVFASDTSY